MSAPAPLVVGTCLSRSSDQSTLVHRIKGFLRRVTELSTALALPLVHTALAVELAHTADGVSTDLFDRVRATVAELLSSHESAHVTVIPVISNGAEHSPAMNAVLRHAMAVSARQLLLHPLDQCLTAKCLSELISECDSGTLAVKPDSLTGTSLWRVAALRRTGFPPITTAGQSPEEACAFLQRRLYPDSSCIRELDDMTDDAESKATSEEASECDTTRSLADSRMSSQASLTTEETPSGAIYSAIAPAEGSETATVLLTGGAGFIGCHTVVALLRRGNRVVVVDEVNDYYSIAQKRDNIKHLEDVAAEVHGNLTFVEANICNLKAMQELFVKHTPSLVVHLAARAGVRPSLEDPHIYIQSNVAGTTVLLELSRLHGVKHFVYASSSSVYGGSTKDVLSETDTVDSPVSPYAATKKSTELLASTFTHLYGLPTSGLRFFTVYGPRGRPDMAPFKFLDLVRRGKTIDQYGDGTSERDYTFVSDIVDGIVRAMDRPDGCQVYNLGNGRPVTLKRFIRLVGDAVGRVPSIRMLPDQPGDVKRTCANIEKARLQLGYNPQVPFEKGLLTTAHWLATRAGE